MGDENKFGEYYENTNSPRSITGAEDFSKNNN